MANMTPAVWKISLTWDSGTSAKKGDLVRAQGLGRDASPGSGDVPVPESWPGRGAGAGTHPRGAHGARLGGSGAPRCGLAHGLGQHPLSFSVLLSASSATLRSL